MTDDPSEGELFKDRRAIQGQARMESLDEDTTTGNLRIAVTKLRERMSMMTVEVRETRAVVDRVESKLNEIASGTRLAEYAEQQLDQKLKGIEKSIGALTDATTAINEWRTARDAANKTARWLLGGMGTALTSITVVLWWLFLRIDADHTDLAVMKQTISDRIQKFPTP